MVSGEDTPELEELERLDLRKCSSVADIVKGMRKCSFGARMLGEVAETVASSAGNAHLIYADDARGELRALLDKMVREKGWFTGVSAPEDYGRFDPDESLVVVGDYLEKHRWLLDNHPGRTVFINSEGKAKPGLIRDGSFKDAVFEDPRFVMPILYYYLEEELEGKRASVPEMIGEIGKYKGMASEVVFGAHTLAAMVADPECTVFMTLSGAMTVAQMGLVITDFVDMGYAQAITSTGALMAHGLVQGSGLRHYKHDPTVGDEILAKCLMNRVTDTIEPESNLNQVEAMVSKVLKGLDKRHNHTPSDLFRAFGAYLAEHHPDERAILQSAYEKGVPVFNPAFADSELGNDVYIFNRLQRLGNNGLGGWLRRNVLRRKYEVVVAPLDDNDRLVQLVQDSKRIGIFTIGGGTPRNWTQNQGPLIEITNERTRDHMESMGLPKEKIRKCMLKNLMFAYGVKICPDKMWYGHLGGCTYKEGMSWRKMEPKGSFAEVHSDATIVWPFIAKYLMETVGDLADRHRKT